MSTIGEQIDEYVKKRGKDYFETAYFYHDEEGELRVIFVESDDGHGWGDVLAEDIRIRDELAANEKRLKSVETRIRSKKIEFAQLEKAIKKLAQYRGES